MTKKLLLLTLGLILASSTTAFAHCGMCGEEDDHGKKGSMMKEEMMEKKADMMKENLGLTDEQAEKLKAAKMKKKEKMKEAKEEYKEAVE